MVRSGLTILSGNAVTSLLLLVRNLAVATLIPVADYGIAATFAIAMAVVEMASALGLHQQIVQSDKGEDPRFQAALQGFQVLRGIVSGLALFALAGPLATFMGVPEVTGAYQVLAVVPVLNALHHFDMHRLNRDMVFGPMVLTGAVPALISLVVIWPLAAAFGDYRVMLWALVVQAVLTAVLSHLVARRPYRLVFDTGVMRDSLVFGWPLLVNSLLLFVVFQGDKVIVGRLMGMEPLAVLAMGMTLTLTPTLVLSKSAQNLLLPRLSQGATARMIQETVAFGLATGIGFVVLMALAGPTLVGWVLGPDYAALETLLIWLGILQGIRVCKMGPAIVALAQGQTRRVMWPNLLRIATVPFIWIAAQNGADLRTLVWIGTLGELAGYGLALLLVSPRVGLGAHHLVAGGILGAVMALTLWPQPGATTQIILILALAVCAWDIRRAWRGLATSEGST